MIGLGVSILQEVLEKGRANQLILNVSNLRKSMHVSLEDACRFLDIEPGEYDRARELVQQKGSLECI